MEVILCCVSACIIEYWIFLFFLLKRKGNIRDFWLVTGKTDCGGWLIGRTQGFQSLAFFVAMRAQYDRSKFTISSQTLQGIHVISNESISKLTKQMTQKRRMRDHGNAFFGTGIEPPQKVESPFTTMLITLAFVRVKDVFIVNDLSYRMAAK